MRCQTPCKGLFWAAKLSKAHKKLAVIKKQKFAAQQFVISVPSKTGGCLLSKFNAGLKTILRAFADRKVSCFRSL